MFKKLLPIFFISFFLLIAALPGIVSSILSQPFIQNRLSELIDGKITVKKIRLSWFGKQSFEQLTLNDGEQRVSFDSLSIDAPLHRIILDKTGYYPFEIMGLTARLKAAWLDIILPFKFAAADFLKLDDFNISYSPAFLKFSGRANLNGSPANFNLDISKDFERRLFFVDLDKLPTELLDRLIYSNKQNLFANAFGPAVSFKILQGSDKNAFNCTLISANLNINADFFYRDGYLALRDSLLFNWYPSAEIAAIYLGNGWHVNFDTSEKASFEVKKLRIPLNFFDRGILKEEFKNFTLESLIKLPDFTLSSSKGKIPKIQFSEILFRSGSGDKTKNLGIHLEGFSKIETFSSKVLFNALLNKPATADHLLETFMKPSEVQLSLEDVPTKPMDHLLGNGMLMSDLLGPNFTLRLLIKPKNLKILTLTLNSKKLEIPNMRFSMDQNLTAENLLKLNRFSGEVKSDALIFKEKEAVGEIRSLDFTWHAVPEFQEFGFVTSFDVVAKEGKRGYFYGSALIKDIFTGNFFAKLNFRGEAFPSSLIKILDSFGEAPDFSVDGELYRGNGYLRFEVKGNWGYLDLNSWIADNFLYLNRPLTAEIKITDYLISRFVAQRLAVAESVLLKNNEKVWVKVDDRGFSFSIYPFDLKKLDFDVAKVVFSDIVFANRGEMRKLVSKLKNVKSDEILLRTTPLYLTIDNGLLKVRRMDMLLMERYPLALWGNIDFTGDRVNLILGLDARALSSIFSLPPLKDNFMLQLPIRGSLNNARLETSKTFAPLAALVAKERGGPEGLLIGKILEITGNRQNKIPPPTTTPLPWKNILDKNKSEKKEKFNPAKEVKKEAAKILKNLLK